MSRFKLNKLKEKNKKGFTLMEIMVAIFVFSIVVLVVMQTFATIIKNYRISRQVQSDNEDLRTALEIMGKNIRMSSNITGASDKITMYNNSQKMCVGYKLEGHKLNYAEGSPSSGKNCSFNDSDYYPIISNYVTDNSKFIVKQRTSGTNAGLVTISLEVTSLDPTISSANIDQDTARVQTSVSTRDYF